MGMSIKKLDARYSGGNLFDYCVEFIHYKDGELFCDVRAWCWETWGPSSELKFIRTPNFKKWAFITDSHRTRIYLSGEQEYSWFILRWSECLSRKR